MDITSMLDSIVPISDFGRGQSARIFDRAKHSPIIVVKHNKPEAVIIAPDVYRHFTELEDDKILLAEALARLERNKEKPTASHADVLKRYGLTVSDLGNEEEVEFE
ncbi:MAG: type II toxin-antitoxin system Phd/YefM family antitoxin [Clostridiales Family XIII bacterium]|jgi:PHD/YefM family antitoxin component YafN of YafNO toxin-antitoxin module|nr:type II toxin-antitoxin system Phd/YefM family antitoxin [Clostridiales Family XIII bacterium]